MGKKLYEYRILSVGILGVQHGRSELGLPNSWEVVSQWLESEYVPKYPELLPVPATEKKYPDIPKLNSYHGTAPDGFWKKFPSKPVPKGVTAKVNADVMEEKIKRFGGKFTSHQIKRGYKLVQDLRNGADAYQCRPLPPARIPNIPSAEEHGEMLTDKLASWVDSGIARGPYPYPPLPGFRANALMAVEKNGNIRPIIHMSKPEGASFNDNLCTSRIEKVHMCIARDFGYALKESGKGSLMSKYDLKDAFKLIPAKPSDWRLQGFCWLGMFFFETNMIFGATPSVSNFDRLGNTLVELAVSKSKIPRKYVLRTLDDIPVLAPKGTTYTISFGMALRGICNDVNVQLAQNCPDNCKAFEHKKKGTVLGICFDSETLQWSLGKDKADKFTRRIIDALHMDYISLLQLQQVMGVLNDLTLMCTFMKPYKTSGNKLLHELGTDKEKLVLIPQEFKEDLKKFARVIDTARTGLPIPSRDSMPPLFSKCFYSDAAGSHFAMMRGERVNLNDSQDRGVACVEVTGGEVTWWCDLTWPDYFLNEARDSKGAHYGSKTTTLEVLGILLPLVSIPEQLCGKHLVFTVDNVAVVFGWDNKVVKFDDTASIMIRAIHLIASYLGCVVHVEHSPRRSSQWEVLVDNLSRKQTTLFEDRRLVRNARRSNVQGHLLKWLENPVENWDLPYFLLGEVKRKLNCP
jgi:hypothetical protein